jgi:hypothetical protein
MCHSLSPVSCLPTFPAGWNTCPRKISQLPLLVSDVSQKPVHPVERPRSRSHSNYTQAERVPRTANDRPAFESESQAPSYPASAQKSLIEFIVPRSNQSTRISKIKRAQYLNHHLPLPGSNPRLARKHCGGRVGAYPNIHASRVNEGGSDEGSRFPRCRMPVLNGKHKITTFRISLGEGTDRYSRVRPRRRCWYEGRDPGCA